MWPLRIAFARLRPLNASAFIRITIVAAVFAGREEDYVMECGSLLPLRLGAACCALRSGKIAAASCREPERRQAAALRY